ncbi:MAG TPA: hypothetical protein VM782_02440 [Stellaceae bacterium]|nr:hypothetical protein [Stellaceae bacterium]
MTPEQQKSLDLIEKILGLYGKDGSFDAIRELLLLLWGGGLTPEYAEAVRRVLLAWARQQGGLIQAAIEDAFTLIGDVAGGAAGAIGLPLIAPLLLLLAGLVLPASRMGDLGLQGPFVAYFGDDCEDFYSALADAYIRLRRDFNAFTGGAATRRGADVLLQEASDLQDACARFHRRCPDSPRNGSVRSMQNGASNITTDVLDWKAHH